MLRIRYWFINGCVNRSTPHQSLCQQICTNLEPFPILGFRSNYSSSIGLSLCSNCAPLETLNLEL